MIKLHIHIWKLNSTGMRVLHNNETIRLIRCCAIEEHRMSNYHSEFEKLFVMPLWR